MGSRDIFYPLKRSTNILKDLPKLIRYVARYFWNRFATAITTLLHLVGIPINSLLLISVCGLWALLSYIEIEQYVDMIVAPNNLLLKLISFLIVAWLWIASFFSCFHLMSFVFSCFCIRYSKRPVKNYASCPNVAVLYTCKNDFRTQSVQSLIRQKYNKYHVYILDDSTETEEQTAIDELVSKHSFRLSIIRRKIRTGFKAGNINHAMKLIGEKYKYFAVVDADEILPNDFLRETIALCEANEKFGFVQTKHIKYGNTGFSKCLGSKQGLHWAYYLPARIYFGFVYFYGHGALIRTKCWTETGGMPEVISEDLGFATRVYSQGYTGYYTNEIVCMEEIPQTYEAWRSRQKRILVGTLEFLSTGFIPFAKSKNVTYVQKLDLLISIYSLYLFIPFFAFIFLLHFVLPVISVGLGMDISSVSLGPAQIFRPMWTGKGLAFTVFVAFAPLCYLIPDAISHPIRTARYICRSLPIFLASNVYGVAELFWGSNKDGLEFIPTGERTPVRTQNRRSQKIELSISAILLCIGILTSSLHLLAIGVSVMVSFYSFKDDRINKNKILHALLLLPIFLTLVGFTLTPVFIASTAIGCWGIALANP